MKTLKNFFPFFAFCILLASCMPKPIDITLPEAKHKLVIASEIIPGGMAVSVSKSFSSLTTDGSSGVDSNLLSHYLLSHANVTVTVNGNQTWPLYNILPGIYANINLTAAPGTVYTLHVKDSVSGMECSASSVMPQSVHFDHIKPVLKKDDIDTSVYLDFDLSNPSGADNYYLIYLYHPNRDQNGDLKSLFSADGDNNMILVDTKQFTNGKYHGHQQVSVSPKSVMGVTLTSVSPEYYKFLSTYVVAAKPLNQLTGEPINFPTNVINGYGYFSCVNPDVNVFDLSKF